MDMQPGGPADLSILSSILQIRLLGAQCPKEGDMAEGSLPPA